MCMIVCKATVDEMERAVKKVDPRKKVEVGGFRMNLDGDTVAKTVQLAKSETYLTELMEKICTYIWRKPTIKQNLYNCRMRYF